MILIAKSSHLSTCTLAVVAPKHREGSRSTPTATEDVAVSSTFLLHQITTTTMMMVMITITITTTTTQTHKIKIPLTTTMIIIRTPRMMKRWWMNQRLNHLHRDQRLLIQNLQALSLKLLVPQLLSFISCWIEVNSQDDIPSNRFFSILARQP